MDCNRFTRTSGHSGRLLHTSVRVSEAVYSCCYSDPVSLQAPRSVGVGRRVKAGEAIAWDAPEGGLEATAASWTIEPKRRSRLGHSVRVIQGANL
jgi:hypothetical protein